MKKALLTIFAAATMTTQVFSQGALPKRSEVPDKYKWNLTDFYKSDADFSKDFEKVKSMISGYKKFEGKIGNSANDLLECIKFHLDVMKLYSKIAVYSSLAKDMDLNDGAAQTQMDRVNKLGAEVSAASSFISPELMAVPDAKIKSYLSQKELAQYKQLIESMLRLKPYTLNQEAEKLLAMTSPIGDIAEETYTILNDAELPFGTTKDENGTTVKISHGRYRSALFSNDREYRKRVYKGTYEPYNQLKSTIATLYNGRVNTRVIESKVRNYKGVLEAYLFPNNIPVSVYENLVKVANDNIKSLHRWAALKKKALKLDELHPYDTYVTLMPGTNKEYTFEEAKDLVLKALEPMGKEYTDAVKFSFDNRWIDVYETDGKRSGAYSNGCGCDVHPWILLNWNNTLDDVFTLIHEIGHNMHSYFSEKTQPYQYRDYATFVAEVASTTNEALLLDYMIEHAKTPEEEASLIEKYLGNAQQTFFRQTRFAEFEKITHEKAEKGEFLNADQLTELFASLYQKYWGPDMVTDYEEGLSWERIPHLYHYNLYVFQYATGFSAAQAFAELIKTNGQAAVDKYLKNFISAGSSVYPIDALKNAGVDMSTSAPIVKMLEKFNKYLDRLEKILDKK